VPGGGAAPRPLRQRIEHAQLLHPDDLPRFAQLGVTASVQFSHAPADRDLADAAWADVAGHAYPYGALLRAGARLVNGSDAPVEELDPLAGLRAGVRRTSDDRPAWHPEQCVPVEAALRAIIEGPVWLAGDEAWRGALRPGMAADLVVLDRNPAEDLDAQIVATMVGGAWTHGAAAMMCE
jgi:predicted amidohydrolase YtcJ